jgi:hypothetical protein
MHGNSTRKFPVWLSLISNYQKRHVSFFIFYVFSSTKWENRRAEQVLWGKPVGTGGRGDVAGEKGRMMKMMKIMYTHVCKYKNDTC